MSGLVPTYHAGQDVVMAVQILRSGVNHDIDSVLDRPEVDRAGKCRVYDERDSLRVRKRLE